MLNTITFQPEGPQPLLREIAPPSDFPTHALGSLREAVEAAAGETQAPLAIAAASALAVASLATQALADVVTLGGSQLLHGDPGHLLAVSVISAVAGTFGDLLESKLKRMAGVKDSGSFMPGHGGFLDRFDSLLLAIPFVWIFCILFMR